MAKIDSKGIRDVVSSTKKKKKKGGKKKFSLINAIRDLIQKNTRTRVEIDRQTK